MAKWEAVMDLADRKAVLVETLINAGVSIDNVLIADNNIIEAFRNANTPIDDVVVAAIAAAFGALDAALAAINEVIPNEVAAQIIKTTFEDVNDEDDGADHVP